MILSVPILLLTLATAPALPAQKYAYIEKELARNGFQKDEIVRIFNDPRIKPVPPPNDQEKKTWDELDKMFASEDLIKLGKWYGNENEHASWLKEASEDYPGISKYYLVANRGIESLFGVVAGTREVFNVFYFKLLDYKGKKWKWNADNLIALIIHAKEVRKDVFWFLGSHGGAMGYDQIQPANLWKSGNHYGHKKQMIDPYDPRQALLTKANFLVKHGGQKDIVKALRAYIGNCAWTDRYIKLNMKYAEALQEAEQNSPPHK